MNEEELGSSGSEIEEEISANHDRLLSSISSLGRKRKKVSQRSEAAAKVSEHNFDPVDQDNVRVGDLLKGLSGSDPSLGSLKRRLTLIEDKQRPVAPPLSKVKADKLQRGVAYVESSKQTGKWAPIVKKNREMEHLSFPLQEDHLPLPSLSTKVDNFKPVSEFEKEIAAVLAGSNNVEDRNDELTEAERQALMKLSLEEATERRKELQKMRALMSYYELKCKRTKKIKSKKFHRIQRKKREVQLSKQQTEPSEELVEKADRLRAEERMTLKHSRMAKWTKQQLSRAHRDDTTQEALAELHQKRQTLKQKSAQNSSSEEDSEDDESGTDTVQQPTTNSANPWLGQSSFSSNKRSGDTANGLVSDSQLQTLKIPETRGLSGPTFSDKFIVTRSNMLTDTMANNESQLISNKHLLSVQEAFAGDDVVEEFEAEKEKLIEESKSKTVEMSMPGWGSWGGQGVKSSRKATKIEKNRKTFKPRRDANIKSVIISEHVDKKVGKHLVSSIPWPFTSKEQFDKNHSTPLGRHWNTEATFQSNVKPRVSTATGCVIEPIKLTDDVHDFIKRTAQKKKVNLANKKGRKLRDHS